jgi:cysteine desulfurase
MKHIYLDYAATTPLHPEVFAAMEPFFSSKYGNPSSLHAFGQVAKEAVEHARGLISTALGARPEEIIFTSSGTEADNFAIKGVAYALDSKGKHIITSAVEHHAVLETCHFLEQHGYTITVVPVDRYGMVDPEDVSKAITKQTILVSIMHANNEVGTIQPITAIGKICKEKEIYFHVDAVQSFGVLNTHVDELNVDLLSLSAHKFYGPKGAGVLYVRKGTRVVPLIHGGGQEWNKRASTHNVPCVVGLGKAVELAMSEMKERVVHARHLRDMLVASITSSIDDVVLNGHPTDRLPNNCHVLVKHIEGEAMLLRLNAHGIAASTGSACSSESILPSHVLTAMGIDAIDAHGSLRFTVGRLTTVDDIAYVSRHLPKIVKELRRISPMAK